MLDTKFSQSQEVINSFYRFSCLFSSSSLVFGLSSWPLLAFSYSYIELIICGYTAYMIPVIAFVVITGLSYPNQPIYISCPHGGGIANTDETGRFSVEIESCKPGDKIQLEVMVNRFCHNTVISTIPENGRLNINVPCPPEPVPVPEFSTIGGVLTGSLAFLISRVKLRT